VYGIRHDHAFMSDDETVNGDVLKSVRRILKGGQE